MNDMQMFFCESEVTENGLTLPPFLEKIFVNWRLPSVDVIDFTQQALDQIAQPRSSKIYKAQGN